MTENGSTINLPPAPARWRSAKLRIVGENALNITDMYDRLCALERNVGTGTEFYGGFKTRIDHSIARLRERLNTIEVLLPELSTTVDTLMEYLSDFPIPYVPTEVGNGNAGYVQDPLPGLEAPDGVGDIRPELHSGRRGPKPHSADPYDGPGRDDHEGPEDSASRRPNPSSTNGGARRRGKGHSGGGAVRA